MICNLSCGYSERAASTIIAIPVHPEPVIRAISEKTWMEPPRSLAARTFSDLRRWMEIERGGHFAAVEQPEALAGEVRGFFRPLRG
jgi:microsomal epoxide hydrolase